MANRAHTTDGTDPTSTALTSAVSRTPSTTRDTAVTVIADWNTIAAATGRTADFAIGALASFTGTAVFNADTLTARRHIGTFHFICPRNKAYTVTASSTTNLTLTAIETPL